MVDKGRFANMKNSTKSRPIYKHLYFQVLVAIAIGVTLGHFFPTFSAGMKPLGDAFIKLIKMMIAPIIFTTVVVGIAKIGDMKEVGRVGLKSLIYFEVVSTLALVIGLVVVNIVKLALVRLLQKNKQTVCVRQVFKEL